jgi:hypothetical protein
MVAVAVVDETTLTPRFVFVALTFAGFGALTGFAFGALVGFGAFGVFATAATGIPDLCLPSRFAIVDSGSPAPTRRFMRPMEARWLSYNAWSAHADMPALSLREQYAKAAARLQTGWTP